jgi:hypothetical protein
MSKQNLEERKMMKVLLSQIKSLRDNIQSIINNHQAAEHSRYVSYKEMASVYNDLAEEARVLLKVPALFYTFEINQMGDFINTIWPQQKKIMELVLANTCILYSAMEINMDFVKDEFDNLENFIKSRLRTVIYEKPDKEMTIQNAIESLLLGRGLNKGIDYDRETGKFEFSGREYIPDFIMPKLQLCIEVKLLREGQKSKIIEEISADITAYGKQYVRQLFVVYDLGYIQNEDEFKRDIENAGDIKLIIVKH